MMFALALKVGSSERETGVLWNWALIEPEPLSTSVIRRPIWDAGCSLREPVSVYVVLQVFHESVAFHLQQIFHVRMCSSSKVDLDPIFYGIQYTPFAIHKKPGKMQ